MKRIIASFIITTIGISAFAQGEFDALKYNQTDVNGTARYMGMGGAFGALGGDPSSISINPAGLGVYRSSEFSITSGVLNNEVKSTLNETSSTDNRYNVPLTNMSYVIAFGGNSDKTSGIVNSNFAITFNKLKNFNRNITINGGPQNSSMTQYMANFTNGLPEGALQFNDSLGYNPFDNVQVPWLSVLAYQGYLINPIDSLNNWGSLLNSGETVRPTYTLSESGYINEWAFSYAANISNKIYLGASLGLQDIDYSLTSQYSETFENGGGFSLTNHFRTTGSGINFKVGTILRPLNFLRIGLSYSTPTFLSLKDTYSANISSTTNTDHYVETPVSGDGITYKIQGPTQVNASLAFILGKKGIISVDYGFTDYTSMILSNDNNMSAGFVDENQSINNSLQDTHSLKIGAEIKLTDNFALRVGYGMVTPATDKNASKVITKFNVDNINANTRTDPEYFLDNNTNYYSGGFGYRENNWFFDVAYMLKNNNQDFYAYNLNGASKATVNTLSNNFVATLGWKF